MRRGSLRGRLIFIMEREIVLRHSDFEAIVYGYGKAVEVIGKQSDIIKSQREVIKILKSTESKLRKDIEGCEYLEDVESIRDWYEQLVMREYIKLDEIYTEYTNYCELSNGKIANYRVFGLELRRLGCRFIRKRDGMWVRK